VDAAKVDGASHFHILSAFFVPLTFHNGDCGLLQFLFSWNDLLGPIILFSITPISIPFNRGLSMLMGRAGTMIDLTRNHHGGCPARMVPMLALYIFGQRYFINGLTRSGIKGSMHKRSYSRLDSSLHFQPEPSARLISSRGYPPT